MIDYVELHCHSHYSLLDGASSPAELVQAAEALGMPALALTDHDAVYGAIPFMEAAQSLKPIVGAELTLDDGHHLTLLVRDQTGWQNLCRLITQARHNAPKGSAALTFDSVADHTEGLTALSGCRKGAIVQALLDEDFDRAIALACDYRDLFFGEFWIELQHHLLPGDGTLNDTLAEIADVVGVDIVATNNVHYATHDRYRLQDILVCINHQTTLEKSAHLRRANSEYYLKPAEEMEWLFSDHPAAIENTMAIAEQCSFELVTGLQDLPEFPLPDGYDAATYLYELCYEGLGAASDKAIEQLEYEISVINKARLANYFLIVWDIVRFSRENRILCQGRGSAANSLVAYLLNITPINPLEHSLVFERFLSEERQIVPDIDIDFQADRREEVIQYVYQKYGLEHAAMACTFVTYRSKSAIRDVGKALSLSPHLVSTIIERDENDTTSLEGYERPLAQLNELVEQIKRFPRHLGIHNGGMVITGTPLVDRVPTEPATMTARYVVQWDKDMLEDAGIIKIDILGLRMLSAIAETVELTSVDLDTLTYDDPAIFETIGAADTVGIFQVESRAQAQILPRLKPKTFNDIIVSISLIRPGPVQGNMVHPYLRRRVGEEEVTYPHPLLEDSLGETLGVILFQEQVLKVTRDLAGFTPGQGELLRRALGSRNPQEAIKPFYEVFVEGALMRGVRRDVVEEVWETLRAFAGYSFPKSHAAAFAVLVYQSAWLKYYYPAAFYVALLNNQPMGFWTPAVVVNDARRHGIEVLGVDIHHSDGICTVIDEQTIRLGFNYIDRMGENASQRLLDAREQRVFANLKDFCLRTKLPRHLVENLILVGAMDAWGIAPRQLLWSFGKLDYQAETLDLIYADDGIRLPDVTPRETLYTEYDILGVALDTHPMSFYQDWLSEHNILTSRTLPDAENHSMVRVAGLLVVRQSPYTAKGVTFLTLEDEDGFVNIVVRPHTLEQHQRLLRNVHLLMVEGKLQREKDIINIVAKHIYPLPRL